MAHYRNSLFTVEGVVSVSLMGSACAQTLTYRF
jgi:hypothetical protein